MKWYSLVVTVPRPSRIHLTCLKAFLVLCLDEFLIEEGGLDGIEQVRLLDQIAALVVLLPG